MRAILVLAVAILAFPAFAQDMWPNHTATDEQVAKEGRTRLPLTQSQIEQLARLLQQTREAIARPGATRGRTRQVRMPGPGPIAEILLRRGYTTALSFTDLTGAAWPIEEVLVDRAFLPGSGEEKEEESTKASHLLYLAPQRDWLQGNAIVKLQRRDEPIVVLLRDAGEGETDFHVDFRLSMPGPNADAAALVRNDRFHAGDSDLLDILTGRIPPRAERLAVTGGRRDDRAWKLDGDLLLLTRQELLSPGPWSAVRGPDDRWAYRLPDVPFVLVTGQGRESRLELRPLEAISDED